MSAFNEGWWNSADGLRLHYRDYSGSGENAGRPPVLCLHGLSRNSRDFEGLAARLSSPAGGGWRVICPDMRGRGRSEYASDPMTYTPAQYVGDVLELLDQAGLDRAGLDQAGIARVVVIGTSLGGLMAMAMAMLAPKRLAGVVLNDVGPVVEPEGLARIATYLGSDPRFASWEEGAGALRGTFATTYPDWGRADWLTMARRLMVEAPAPGDTPGDVGQGPIRFDYDPRIAVPFFAGASAPLPDLWPALEALTATPLLFLRGALSEILSGATLEEMLRRAPGAEALSLPRIGHAPTLDEPEAVAAILRLLDKVA